MKETKAPAIGKAELQRATETLRRYKNGKAQLERRIIENEAFWRLRHWEQIPEQGTSPLRTKSAWLVNVILSKHADAMDAFPEPACLPRAADDEAEAALLSKVVPAVLEQNDFQKTWSDNWWKKLKDGVAFYGVFWDRSRFGGRGDVAIERVDPLNLYWEPGVDDLQESRNLFHVALRDNDELVEEYPALEGKLRPGAFPVSRYLYDETVDTANKSPVIDWYYKKRVGGRTVLHYVKYVGETVLFATENEVAPQPVGAHTCAPADDRPTEGEIRPGAYHAPTGRDASVEWNDDRCAAEPEALSRRGRTECAPTETGDAGRETGDEGRETGDEGPLIRHAAGRRDTFPPGGRLYEGRETGGGRTG